MTSNRLDVLRGLVAQSPNDVRTRYMLAMELANTGDPAAAVTEYRAVIAIDQDYVAAYFHCGQALERIDEIEEARSTYRAGIDVCSRTGDEKTRSELQEVLDAIS